MKIAKRILWSVVGIFGGVLILAIGLAVGNSETPTTEYVNTPSTVTIRQSSTAVPTPTKSGPTVVAGPGVYLVGTDIEPGTYTTDGEGSLPCYWARKKNDSGELGSIISNHLGAGKSRFTTKKGEIVEISRCIYTKAS